MSISISLEFQNELQKIFESNLLLTNHVKNIFQSLKQSTKYPYIFHKVNQINILPSAIYATYEITGEINIYSRESSSSDIKLIISLIEEAILSLNDKLLRFRFICGKIIQAEFTTSHDQITNRVQMIFSCSIQER